MIDQATPSPAKWLRNAWQAAALSGEIGEQLFARTFLDEPVVLWRTPAGEVRALADRCAHRFVPLSAGRLDDGIIECGYHGMRFDETGACVGVPGQASVAPRATVRSYPVTEMHGLVWIWMGDPQRSRAAVVPDVRWRELAGWKFIGGYEHVAADYRLLNDNLLDLSHESFVHRDTIGNHAVADAPFEVETIDDRVVKLHRDMLDCDPPPSYRGTNGTGKIDRWHTTYFTPPGYHLNYNGSKPAGAPMDAAREGRVMHLLTPETDRSTHYFYGAARAHDIDNAELDAAIERFGTTTIAQDKRILELQQRAFDRYAESDEPVRIKLDAGAVLGRRLLERRIAEEHA